jgi:hypothetical protein
VSERDSYVYIEVPKKIDDERAEEEVRKALERRSEEVEEAGVAEHPQGPERAHESFVANWLRDKFGDLGVNQN